MSLTIYKQSIALLIFLGLSSSLAAMFPNLTKNDPLPVYSSVYPYSYLATRQKAHLMRYDYSFVQPRFRVSVSGYRQFANRGRDDERDVVNLGDLKGRWNMLAFFYDPKLANVLYDALGIDPNPRPPVPPNTPVNKRIPDATCKALIEDPRFSDPNHEFGFFSIPLLYRKYGVRFESEILLIDRCFYGVGLMVQWGINDVRQTVLDYEDFTCQALGTACPANSFRGVDPTANRCTVPAPATVQGITPPFVDPTTIPPCGQTACNPTGRKDCVDLLQPFQPCCNQRVCFSFPGNCKEFVIDNIMSQKDVIAQVLGLDICNYHKVGLDDLRISMFWRHLYMINEDDDEYPRVLFMPFAQAGVGIPMMKGINNSTVLAVPNGNNRHTYVSGRAGFTIDFLDTIDIWLSGGFSYFFEREYCNFRMPTNPKESGIFPYAADVNIRPGPTWSANFGMHAYHFLDNLSVWIEYAIVSHAKDHIEVCRSFIPEGSIYFDSGFDVERAECFSKWESHVVNVGFNYDLYNCLSIGLLWQAPAKQRNAYRSGTILGTISFVY